MRTQRTLLAGVASLATAAASYSVFNYGTASCPAECYTTPPLNQEYCDELGFTYKLTAYQASTTGTSGFSSFTFQVCQPANGICSLTTAKMCTNQNGCDTATEGACVAKCNKDILFGGQGNEFRGLSHFDVFADLSCLTQTQFTNIVVTCSPGTPIKVWEGLPADQQRDPSCDSPTTQDYIVDLNNLGPGDTNPDFIPRGLSFFKCDSTNLQNGQCATMTLSIPGEAVTGKSALMTKAGQGCELACVPGPRCQSECSPPSPTNDYCISRTRGFWGTHPAIITGTDLSDVLSPSISVCGTAIVGTGAESTLASPKLPTTSQALCYTANEEDALKPNLRNPARLQLVAQLTAAKLNLAATAQLVSDAVAAGTVPAGSTSCATWKAPAVTGATAGMSISQVIAACEMPMCVASKTAISASGCIEALTAFNESPDVLLGTTDSAPFNRPGPANIAYCQIASGDGYIWKNTLP